MDYNEKLLNSKGQEINDNSFENNKNCNENEIKIGYNNTDAFHHANVFSKLFFCWVNKIFKITRKQKITCEALGKIDERYSSRNFSDEISKVWFGKQYYLIKSNPLFKTIIRLYLGTIIFLFFYGMINTALSLVGIAIFDELITFFKNPSTDRTCLIKIGSALIGSKLISILLARQYSNFENNVAVEATQKLICFIFQKFFKSSPSDSSENTKSTSGEIINFIQVDSQKLGYMLMASPQIFILPIKISVFIYLLFYYLGYSFLAGIVIFIVCGIINYFLFSNYGKREQDLMSKKDLRMRLNNEVFENLKLLKMYAWEDEFKKRIMNIRNDEIGIQKILVNTATAGIAMYWAIPVLATLGTIGTYQYLNEKMDIKNIMTGLYIFGLLQTPLSALPYCITCIIDTMVALKRIEDYLREPEIDETKIINDDNLNDVAIKIDNCSFTWRNLDETQNKNASNKTNHNDNSINDTGDEIPCSTEKKEKNLCVLKNINLTIKKGEFIGVIGELGSGKSSLLQAIMNNLSILDANELKDEEWEKNIIHDSNRKIKRKQIVVNGKLGYTSQIPWIQNETLRNNILFFEDFEESKYKNVLRACNLEKDIENFEGKDLIEIGEKGINLSGGQKSRISVARAVYSDRDIYLFDDPISSLDADVGKKVFIDCFQNYLKDKTRILVTHNINYLSFFDRIVWIGNNKEIIFDGYFEQLKNEEFYINFMKEKSIEKNKDSDHKENILPKKIEKTFVDKNLDLNIIIDPDLNPNLILERDMLNHENYTINHFDGDNNKDKDNEYKENGLKNSSVFRITKDEDQESGSIKFSVFLKYFEYMGGKYIAFLVSTIMLFWIAFKALSDLWLANWTKKSEENFPDTDSSFPFNIKDNFTNYLIYSGLALLSVIFVSLRMIILSKGTLKICNDLHRDMINYLIKAPINLFHESTPRGIIYNRLSKDLEYIQYNIYAIGSLLVDIFGFIGGIFVCSFFEIHTLIFIPFLVLIGFFIYSYYLRTSRELQRLEGVSRSPILNIISESIPGGSIIRVFEKVDFYKKKFYEKVDDNYKTNLFINGCKNWFGLIIDFLSTIFLTFLIVFVILIKDKFTPQSIALMLTYTLSLQDILFDFFQEFAFFQNNMISMERCLKFLEIPQEKEIIVSEEDILRKEEEEKENERIFPKSTENSIAIQFDNNQSNTINSINDIEKNITDAKLFAEISLYRDSNNNANENINWPVYGEIEFVNYSVKYRPDMPIILKNLNFRVLPKERIGIVGRTGSGKSTICNCIFRILEAHSGKILIDGVDISKITLPKLRKNLTIIPQDPFIFNGTLKYNVDPLEIYSKNDIESCLKMIGYNFQNNEKGIERSIDDNGSNISVGEKQLICIARAILRKSKIIIMDEATANIDYQTEEKIQKALNEYLKESTILTIAHRIKTVMSFDKILVLDEGNIEEFDSPRELLKDPNSYFYKISRDPSHVFSDDK